MSAPTPARKVAYEVLRRVFEHGAWADRALRSAVERHGVEGRERAQAQHLAYGAVQRRGTIDYLLSVLADRKPQKIDPPLLAALRLGAYELLFAGAAADHAAVDQAVELAKGGRDGGRRHRGAGLVNAVLRRLIREGDDLLAAIDSSTPEGAAIAHSMPEWIARLWFEERGHETALVLMAAANEPPARTYRLADPAAGVPVAGLELVAGLPDGVVLLDGAAAAGDQVEAAVSSGALVPQAFGSALAAASLGAQPGERVLDLCAAPGIKTTQLAATVGPGGAVTAVEKDEGRAGQLTELCERVGVANVNVVIGDATVADIGAGYDRVLVDAPCTGLGTLAARPDARWRRRSGDVAELAGLQTRLLGRGIAALRPGGRAVYSVCTVSRTEGESILAGGEPGTSTIDLTAERPALGEPAAPGALQTLPGRDGSDGFFIAALETGAGR